MGFLLRDLKKHIKSALKKLHNLPHNGPFLPHNFPWKCRTIFHFLPHPIRNPDINTVIIKWLMQIFLRLKVKYSNFFWILYWLIFLVSSLISDKSETERRVLANREKEKGNEAFQSGNYSEALMYYCRSIELNPQVTAVYNNRALAGMNHVLLEENEQMKVVLTFMYRHTSSFWFEWIVCGSFSRFLQIVTFKTLRGLGTKVHQESAGWLCSSKVSLFLIFY